MWNLETNAGRLIGLACGGIEAYWPLVLQQRDGLDIMLADLVHPSGIELRSASASRVANSGGNRCTGPVVSENATEVLVCPQADCVSRETHFARHGPA